MPAVLFGSISTVADTSELQRAAFNAAFREHGLDWQWDQGDYREMLATSGGKDRIAAYAEQRGEDVDAAAVHETKSRLFQHKLAEAELPARPGVASLIRDAKSDGLHVALVTTTSADNIAALLNAVPEIEVSDFDLVVDAASVTDPKPDPAAYALALSSLDTAAEECVAIEDNVGGVQSAVAAGVVCVAFPNANTAEHDFAGATTSTDRLDFAEVSALIPAR